MSSVWIYGKKWNFFCIIPRECQLVVGAPCLSFDIVDDDLGGKREAYPHTCFLVSGTQAARSHTNNVIVMKMHNLNKWVWRTIRVCVSGLYLMLLKDWWFVYGWIYFIHRTMSLLKDVCRFVVHIQNSKLKRQQISEPWPQITMIFPGGLPGNLDFVKMHQEESCHLAFNF